MPRIVLVALLSVVSLAAQPRGVWWDGQVADDLQLRPEQREQIRAAVRENRSRLSELRQTVETAESDLQAVFNAPELDTKRANDAINRLATARGELVRTVSQMTLRMRMALTPEQWSELRRRFPAGRNGRVLRRGR